MATIDSVKTALRISHNRLDDEINRTIGVARAELTRAGVSAEILNSGELADEAIITYCLYKMAPSENERFFNAFVYQCDNLRKHAVTNNEQ